MFQFPEFAHLSMFPIFNWKGCPIRKSTDQILFADPRSLSQLITSFFASESLGIPHTPLFTSFNDLSFPAQCDSCGSIITLLEFFLCARSCCKSVLKPFQVLKHPTTYIIFNFTPRFARLAAYKRFATLYYSFISMSMNVFAPLLSCMVCPEGNSSQGTRRVH